jgi:hypothetical protein
VVFIDVLIVGRLYVGVRALLLLAYTKHMLPLIVCFYSKMSLLWHERLARSPVTKLIGLHKLFA